MKHLFLFFLGLFICTLFAPLASVQAAGEIDLMVDFPNKPDNIKLYDPDDEKRKGAIPIMEQYVERVFVFGAGLVAVVAVLWIIVGGYEIMFSGAGSGEISSGKEKITKAILGLVLVFLSALILHTINPGFFAW